jgi:hypothetical protein
VEATGPIRFVAGHDLRVGQDVGRAHGRPKRSQQLQGQGGLIGPLAHERMMTARRFAMQWVTREHPKTDRVACPWLIRKFIDPLAEIVYVPRDEVLSYAEENAAISFDAPGARYTHRDGLCSFEVLVQEYAIDDPGVGLMARIVHGADVAGDVDTTPQSAGLLAIADGFAALGIPDQEQLRLELPVYDALYAWATEQATRA